MLKYLILISGRGSNMDALLDAQLPGQCAAVISNRPAAAGLAHAAARGIPTQTVDHTAFPTRAAFDAALAACIDAQAPDFVLLAGFMRILGDDFVRHYAGRLVNIHPSLLPAFPGTHTHQRALDAGVCVHGCTVHFVTPTLDGGPIIAQAAIAVHQHDDATTLAARVLREEHRLYPAVARALLQGQVQLDSAGRVHVAHQLAVDQTLHVPRFA